MSNVRDSRTSSGDILEALLAPMKSSTFLAWVASGAFTENDLMRVGMAKDSTP